MHRLPAKQSVFWIVLAATALFFVVTAAHPVRALAQTGPNHAATANQSTPEPVETPTPLPTFANLRSGGSPGNAVLVGLMLVCVMGLMLIGGVGIAILIVKARTKMQR